MTPPSLDYQSPTPPTRKVVPVRPTEHSLLGTASVVLGSIAFLCVAGGTLIGLFSSSRGEWFFFAYPFVSLLPMAMLVPIGFLLGLVGMLQTGRKTMRAAIGFGLNLGVFVLAITIPGFFR